MLEPSRSAKTIGSVLGEYEGIVMCDAYSAYQSLAAANEGRIRLAHCFAARGLVLGRKNHYGVCPTPRMILNLEGLAGDDEVLILSSTKARTCAARRW